MYTSKMKALDSEDSEEDDSNSGAAPAVTREALEQRALLQYQEALQMENTGSYLDSENLLKSLLESQILSDLSDHAKVDASQKTSFTHLKYCVSLNLGHCLVKQDKLEEGLDYYLKASRIEDSDLNLWYKMGRTAVRLPDLRLAATSFTEGLRISPNHWGCIDNLVTVLYALGDFLTCLYFVTKGLEMDSGFVKGHVFKKAILYQSPFLKTDFSLYYPGWELKDGGEEEIDSVVESRLLGEANRLSEKERKCWNVEPSLPDMSLCRLGCSLTWLQLTSNLLRTHNSIYETDPKRLVYQPVEFDYSTPMETSENVEPVVKESSQSEASAEATRPEEENDDQAKGGVYEKWLSCQKRRSARVRSTVRREEPSLARSLAHLVPTHLLHRNHSNGLLSEDSLETMDLYRLFESKESDQIESYKKNKFTFDERKKVLTEDGYFGSYKEVEDVRNFMCQSAMNKFTVVDCIKACVLKLSAFWNLLWPENLSKTFVQMFKLMMKYNPPNICRGNDLRTVEEDLSVLMYGELLLDRWLEKGKDKGKPGPLGTTLLGGDFPSLYLGALDRRACVSTDPPLITRIHWLQGMLFYYSGEAEPTTNALEILLHETWFEELEVKLPNIQQHYLINSTVVSDILRSLNINRSLSRVVELYEKECYEDVVHILSESLLSEQLVANSGSEYVVSRFRQFSLIIDSLCRLCKYKECFYWSECFLFDCLNDYKNSTVEEERATNSKCIVALMDGILSIIDTVGNIVCGTLPSQRQSRLVQTLSSIICLQMDVPETTTEMCIESIAPWLLLYHVIKYDEELKEKKLSCLNWYGSSVMEDCLPASLTILHQGHDYLGRRGWCCFNEGSLLYFSLDIMYPLLDKLNPESKTLSLINQEIDQIFYCLYGQQKKSKGRHLADHKTLGLALTWNRARQIFRFTKPKELPSYDSSGKCAINSDTESMYHKLISFVPTSCDPSQVVPEMTKFLEGEIEEVPLNTCRLPEDITNIYYLLAHFYFRNKSWNKALKFYLLDVCANPSRVDSWACLALARGSLIDTKINSCDVIKNENEVLKSADMVSRCYDRSLRLDPLQSTLWIEKGSFSYTMHSFCSNLLKKEVNLSLEMFDILESKKESMLSSAMDCFSKANKIWYSCQGFDIQDERWLHHYMMGKICEKKGEDPQVFIDHYLKAAELLHEMGAFYPSCISYAAPQRLAVESLEVYYRVHASTLKYLGKYECKQVPKNSFLVYRSAVSKLAKSPFVLLSQTTKDEVVKTEACPLKEVKTPGIEDPYSPGDKTADYSSSNSQALFKTHEVNIDSIASKNKDSNTPQESCSRTEAPRLSSESQSIGLNLSIHSLQGSPDKKSSLPSFSLDTQTVKELNPEPVAVESKPSEKLSGKEDSDKRTLSIESDTHTTSDSVSKASGPDKPSKSSDSSSDDSSSSDSDSSSDSSSSDSSSSSSEPDSESNQQQEVTKAVEEVPPQPVDWEAEYDKLTSECLKAMENCTGRFQEHFKSLYHLAHFYFKSKKQKDLLKVKKILLETGGLFAERKSSNFFNGIWRIPNNEIDRPGNFAAHMGRCTQLLLEYLKETRDYKMLIDLALFLKLVPDADKKYLRDTERGELCHEALSLAAISLRKRLAQISGEALLRPFLIDVFSIYKKVSRSSLKEPVFTAILGESFSKITGQKSESNLEADVQAYLKRDPLAPSSENLPLIPTSIPTSLSIEPILLPAVSKPLPTPPASLPSQVPPPVVSPQVIPPPVVPPPQVAPLDLQTKSPNVPTVTTSRGRSGGPKRPRGRPPGSVNQPLRHSITSILQQRPDMFLPVDPYRPKARPSLSITPVAPRPRKPRAQARPQVPIPASISITSIPNQPRPFSFQSVSITPRARFPPPETRLPPATIIPLPLQQPTQPKPRPRPAPAPPVTGPPPPKIPHLEFNVAQAIRNLGNTITITTSTGETSRSKSSGSVQPPPHPLSKPGVPQPAPKAAVSLPTSKPLVSLPITKPAVSLPMSKPVVSVSKPVVTLSGSSSKSVSKSSMSGTKSPVVSLSGKVPVVSLTSTKAPVVSLSGTKPMVSLSASKSLVSKPVVSLPSSKPVVSLPSSKPVVSLPSSKPVVSLPISKPTVSQASPTASSSSTSQQKDPNIQVIILDD